MTIDAPDAIILAGGEGRRLKGILRNLPKPMAVIKGKPFIEWILFMLHRQGIRRVIICTGYHSEVVESYFKKKCIPKWKYYLYATHSLLEQEAQSGIHLKRSTRDMF